jgi:hypothetical protein
MNLDRRRFLQIAALGGIATVIDCSSDRESADLTPRQLLAMLGPDTVRAIGTHYRAATPSENTATALRSAIANGSQRFTFIKAKSLDDRIRDDFAADRTTTVDGWILSITEARQCALYSLTAA